MDSLALVLRSNDLAVPRRKRSDTFDACHCGPSRRLPLTTFTMTGRNPLFTIGLVLGLCAKAVAQPSAAPRSPAARDLERRVDSLFAREIRPDGPGCAVGVYRNGEVVLTRGYGLASVEDRRPITSSTAFNIGSVSKPFTALAALMLEQRGRLSLDDDVRRWIPELPDYGRPIRIRDLLQHTSGLRDYGVFHALSGRPVATMAEFLGLMAAQRALNFPTGSRHEYSHSDFVLLGIVIERVTGVPFGEHLEREVLVPLGMRGSFVHDVRAGGRKERAFGHVVSVHGTRIQFPASTIVAGSNLYTSVTDLARWDRNFDQPDVGGRAVIQRMLSRPTLASGDAIPYAYGLRLGTHRGLRTVSRGGHDDAMRSEIIRFPDQRLTVATLCNADHLEAGRFAQAVAALYLAHAMSAAAPKPMAPAAVAVAPNELAKYAGLYMPPGQPWYALPIEVRNGVIGEVLFHETRDDTLIVMTPVGNGRFFELGLTGNVGLFTFRSSSPSAPLRLEITWNGEPAGEAERVADSLVWRPSGAALAEYAGSWFSEEMDAGWRLEVRGERLALRRHGQPDLTLLPIVRDQFVRGFGSWASSLPVLLQFERESTGALAGFTISTAPGEDSVRGLRFVRVGR